jgi:ribonuclease HII
MTPVRPSLAREREAWAEAHLLVGVDEVGRGPLAGPVVAAAVVFPERCRAVPGVRDSKTLPAAARTRIAILIQRRALGVALGAASVREIDRLNIRVATALAMHRAITRLLRRLQLSAYRIIIDGLPLPEVGYQHTALVAGDSRCHSIAAAGIVAKTVRDRLMQRLAVRYPGYGWLTNVGYGTTSHHDGIRDHGITRHHRASFAPCAQLGLFGETIEPELASELPEGMS